MDRVFYIAPAFMPNEAAVGQGVVDAAARGGARRRAPLRLLVGHRPGFRRRGLVGSALTLRAILGREPRTLRAYLEELAAGAPPEA